MTTLGRRSGMTLVEVLCALVLLSALAAASLPLLVEAQRVAREPAPSFDAVELGELADAIAADPKAFGHDELPDAATFPWPGHSDRPVVSMHTIPCGDPPTHLWRVFECDGIAVFRWSEAPPP